MGAFAATKIRQLGQKKYCGPNWRIVIACGVGKI
jgi:hypothetical protein